MPFRVLQPANQATNQPTTTSGFRVLRPATPTVSQTQPVQPAQPEKKLFGNSLLGKVGNFLTESEQKLGSSLGQGLALASGTGKSIEESNKKLIDSGNELIRLAQQTTDPKKKKQRLDLAKKNFEQAGVNYKEIVPDIQKSNKQIIGEGIGTALDVVTAGTAPKVLSGVVKSARVPSLATKLPISTVAKGALKGVATGAPLGAAYGITGALQEDKGLKGTLTSGALGGALGGVIGATTGALGAKVSNTLKYNPARATAKVEAQADKLARKIVQGVDKDVAKARNVLRSIDAKGVKTAEDLVNAVNKNLEAIGNKVDEKLLTNNNLYNIADLTVTKKVGNKNVSENFVTKALDNLEELYTKTDDIVSAEQIKQLKAKAQSQGLTAKEINDLARNYGSEFGSKAFSKIGEPLTSVNAQSYENIRKGVKESARSLFDDEALKTLDKELSEHIRVKELAVKFQKGVSNLENKVKERAPLELAGRVVGRVLDTVTGGATRGFLTSFLPSNVGNKVMNYLDLEKALNKNLKALQKLEKVSPFDLEKEIQKAINYFKNKLPEQTKNLKNNQSGFVKLPFNKLGNLEQEARKYKSAEEFVKAQGTPVYKNADSFVKDIQNRFGGQAQFFDPNKLELYETTIDRKLVDKLKEQIKSGDDGVFLHREWKSKTPAIRVEELGYGKYKVNDGNHRLLAAQELGLKNVPVNILGFGDTDLALRVSYKKGATDLYPLKTKSQLTDIWNKANKLPPRK